MMTEEELRAIEQWMPGPEILCVHEISITDLRKLIATARQAIDMRHLLEELGEGSGNVIESSNGGCAACNRWVHASDCAIGRMLKRTST